MSQLIEKSLDSYVAILNEEGLFKNLFNNLTEGLLIIDTEGKITFWNKAAEKITGFSDNEVLEKFSIEDRIEHRCINNKKLIGDAYPLFKSMNSGATIYQKAFIIHKNSYKIPVNITVIPIKDEEDYIVGAIEIFQDDSVSEELEKIQEKFNEASFRDPVTKLFNRQEMLERISIEIEKSSRYEMPVCLALCDIEGFKTINEKWGHHSGDIVLKKVGEVLQHKLRKTDVTGRYEGGRFIILLPLIDIHRANLAIEKLRSTFENFPINTIEPDTLAVNFGLTEILPGDNLKEFISRAENALIKAKKLGRNRIEIFR